VSKDLTQPILSTVNIKKGRPRHREKTPTITGEDMVLITGSAHKALAQEISELTNVPLLDTNIGRFADGEVSIKFNENIRAKDVFIIQPSAAPVNDSIMELLLTISCARRSGAQRITAVVPYFGYKHHRRGHALSSKNLSRFLTSGATDFAKMMQSMGVDKVIAVDLQRAGQGHEACFFDNKIPLENVVTRDFMINYMVKNVPLQPPIVVVTPNSECVRKARNFQLGFKKAFQSEDVGIVAFFRPDVEDFEFDAANLQLLGKAKIGGADVVVVDDMVDTAGTLSILSKRLAEMGARNVYFTASHGIFSEKSMEKIKESPLKQVIVTNTLPLHDDADGKVVQVSVAPMLAHVILAEHYRSAGDYEDVEEEQFVIED
jgi:ribose-phosphate pyrophosphokinase